MKYNSNMDMDDWLITPAIKLEAGKSYKFSVSAHAHSSSYPERLEVKYGRTPDVEGMTNELIPATEITTKLNKKFEGTIVADESGKFYIGFHGVSKADNYYLYISEFTIEAGEKLAVPVAPADLTVTPAADCSTQAEISLTAPSVDVYGTELTELSKFGLCRHSTPSAPERSSVSPTMSQRTRSSHIRPMPTTAMARASRLWPRPI